MLKRIELSAPLSDLPLGEVHRALEQLAQAGLAEVWVDVCDGRFEPALAFGPAMIACAKAVEGLSVVAHVKAHEPGPHLAALAEAGADAIVVHAEACTHGHRTLSLIAELGPQPGIAVRAATPLTALQYLLPLAGCVVSCVETEAGVPPKSAYDRIRILQENIQYHEYRCKLVARGACGEEAAARLFRLGADALVMDGMPLLAAPMETWSAALEQMRLSIREQVEVA